jgi:hypothetical protein
MTTSWTRCIATARFAGVAALIAVAAWSVPSEAAADPGIWVAQYCAPAAENSETHRVYCRDDRG